MYAALRLYERYLAAIEFIEEPVSRQVLVKTLTGKAKIQDKNARLVFAGEKLEHDRTLSAYNIQ